MKKNSEKSAKGQTGKQASPHSFRPTLDDWPAIEHAAKAAGMNINQFLNACVAKSGKAVVEERRRELEQAIKELSRLPGQSS